VEPVFADPPARVRIFEVPSPFDFVRFGSFVVDVFFLSITISLRNLNFQDPEGRHDYRRWDLTQQPTGSLQSEVKNRFRPVANTSAAALEPSRAIQQKPVQSEESQNGLSYLRA
jgi:hypothetical protein